MRGGKRQNAGRKPGAVNKVNREAKEKARKGGEMPLDYMLRVMRDATASDSRRDSMAVSAGQYLHSKMPIALVAPPSENPTLDQDDHSILNTYLGGVHEEAE